MRHVPQGAHEAQSLLRAAEILDADDDRRAAGERPLYAIDSNVAIFLSQPSEHAIDHVGGGLQRQGFGAVFPEDPPNLSDVISHALAEHLYFEFRHFGPILIIPPVSGELHRHAQRLTRRAVHPATRDITGWREQGQRLIAKLERQGQFTGQTEDLLRQVQELLFLRYGPPSALRRLRHMLGQRGLVSSDIASASEDLLPDAILRRALSPTPSARRTLELTFGARRWISAGLERDPQYSEAAFRDGFVMARLERMNEALERSDSPYRVIYVTADRHLLDVVQRQGNPHLRLRHPRAWLTRLPIFQHDRETEHTSLMDLLKLAVKAREGESSENDALLESHWHEYLAKATALFVPREETRELFFDRGRDIIDRYSASVDRFQDDLSKLQEQAWEDCFSVSAITAATEVQQEHRDFARTVPPIVLEDWEATQRGIDQFLSWHTPQDYDETVFQDSLRAITQEEPSGYARYLALSAIFASRGDWDLGASLALRAWERVPCSGGGYAQPNGREASFIEAVCRRHTARTVSDLDSALAPLVRAEEIWTAEQSSSNWDVVPERFDAERLASDVTRFYFLRYASESVLHHQDTLLALADRLFVFLRRVRGRLEEADLGERQRRALEQLLVRTIINILGLGLISQTSLPAADAAWDEADGLGITEFPGPQNYLSNLARITLLAYRRIVLRGKSKSADRELHRLLLAAEGQRVFPYDEARFTEIARIAFGSSAGGY